MNHEAQNHSISRGYAELCSGAIFVCDGRSLITTMQQKIDYCLDLESFYKFFSSFGWRMPHVNDFGLLPKRAIGHVDLYLKDSTVRERWNEAVSRNSRWDFTT